ncbi:hypothetical protein P3T76_001777 [Phytophthora citrophthora]|uniref:Secreted protein n=1 Tax=Phytophthora citrophthora TaxID=4793 RepID=A0AAD9LTJ0_9STRA|nr:hypothetical protein P3T76_001777 [Phytophthora citrophthora]
MFGSLVVVHIVVFVQLWQVYYHGNLQVTEAGSTSSYRSACTNINEIVSTLCLIGVDCNGPTVFLEQWR